MMAKLFLKKHGYKVYEGAPGRATNPIAAPQSRTPLRKRRRLWNRDGRDPDGVVRPVIDAGDRRDDLPPWRRSDEECAGLHDDLRVSRVKSHERIELLHLARAEIDRNTSSEESAFREHPKVDRRAGSLVHEHEIRACLFELGHSDEGGGRHVRDLVPPAYRRDVL